MPTRSIQVRPRALHDLEDIYKYSLGQWGRARAEAYLSEINRAFEALANHDKLGRDYSRVRADLLAYNIAAHVIFYTPTPSGILVVRVLHKSMDHVRHLA
ncbi:MAG: type II toxin-antitoxin system RelE/ParE family toxin [Nitrospirales bacterium]